MFQWVMSLILFGCVFEITTGHNIVNYTDSEMENIYKVRVLLGDLLQKEYMKEDVFIYNFLEARDQNVNKAAAMIQDHLKWRFDNRIDFIVDEVNEVEKELPYSIGRNKDNTPVIFIRLGTSDLRKVLINGKEEEAIRAAWKIVENLYIKSRKFNQSKILGIVDLNGFTYKQHACKQCIPFGERVGRSIEDNYPGLAKAVFFINTSRLFEVFMTIIRATLSVSTENVLHVYGFDKEEWINALLKYISKDELERLLGHKIRAITKIHDINEVSPKAESYRENSKLMTPSSITTANKGGKKPSQNIVALFMCTYFCYLFIFKQK